MSRFSSFMASAYGITAAFNVSQAILVHRFPLEAVINWFLAMVMLWWFIDEIRDIVRHDRSNPSLTIRADLQGQQIAEAIRRHNARSGAA